jgi:hypothetical protein
MEGLELLCWFSALNALTGAAVARQVRPRLVQDAAITRTFAIPGIVLGVVGAALMLLLPQPLEATPLLAAGALFGAAAWAFAPTARGRFARFERAFWDHVHAHESRHAARD